MSSKLCISLSKGKKKKNPRSKFLSAFMREITGDFGNEIIDHFMNGRNEELGAMWNELGAKMKKKASGQKASSKRTSESATSEKFPNVRSVKDTKIETEFNGSKALVRLTDRRGRTIVEWRNDDVNDATTGGILDSRDYQESAYEYAKQLGII
jgi:hypothetical protein